MPRQVLHSTAAAQVPSAGGPGLEHCSEKQYCISAAGISPGPLFLTLAPVQHGTTALLLQISLLH